jgi:hypothetical protein
MALTYTNDTNTIQLPSNAISKVKLKIHYQLSGTELVHPIYVSNCSTCRLSPNHRVDADSIVQVGFNIDLV